MTTEFKVKLTFVEGGSSKFWRARIEGTTLYVNYGRIGTQGQTQLKQLGSLEAAEKELAKLEREKRKKGYVDEGSAGAAGAEAEAEDEGDEGEETEDGDEESEAEPQPSSKATTSPAPAAPVAAAPMNLALDRPDRKVEMRLVLEGASLRMIAVERYSSPEGAKQALERLKAVLEAEGYKASAPREL